MTSQFKCNLRPSAFGLRLANFRSALWPDRKRRQTGDPLKVFSLPRQHVHLAISQRGSNEDLVILRFLARVLADARRRNEMSRMSTYRNRIFVLQASSSDGCLQIN